MVLCGLRQPQLLRDELPILHFLLIDELFEHEHLLCLRLTLKLLGFLLKLLLVSLHLFLRLLL